MCRSCACFRQKDWWPVMLAAITSSSVPVARSRPGANLRSDPRPHSKPASDEHLAGRVQASWPVTSPSTQSGYRARRPLRRRRSQIDGMSSASRRSECAAYTGTFPSTLSSAPMPIVGAIAMNVVMMVVMILLISLVLVARDRSDRDCFGLDSRNRSGTETKRVGCFRRN
jgi:hypothetical protein